VSKGTRLATASFAAPHESVDDDDSWRLSATQNPSRESSTRRAEEDAPEGAAIGACLLPASGSALLLARLFLDSAGAGTRLVRGSQGMGWPEGPQGEDASGQGPSRAGTVWQGQTMMPRCPFAMRCSISLTRSRMYRPAPEASALRLPACEWVYVYKYQCVTMWPCPLLG
jgi:hypothetical protein